MDNSLETSVFCNHPCPGVSLLYIKMLLWFVYLGMYKYSNFTIRWWNRSDLSQGRFVDYCWHLGCI